MNAIAQERFGPAVVLGFQESDRPEICSGDVLRRVHRSTVSPHGSPVLRGAAYIAALRGDPWRPQI